MSAHVSVYIDKTVPLTVCLNEHNPARPFVTIDLDDKADTYIVARTRAEADALVKAALAARDLLPAPEPEAGPCGCCLCVCPRLAEIEGKCAACREGEHARGAWERTGEFAQRFTTHCPICSGHLEPDGSHVCPGSGARIPPAGLDAECEPAVTA